VRLAIIAALTAVLGPASANPGEVVRVEHHDPHAVPSRGPTYAPVTIELFFVPGQSTRSQLLKVFETLQAEHPTRVRLIYRVLKRNQATLALAALEAHAQGKFFELVDLLGNQRANPTKEQLVKLAGDIGVDRTRLELALDPKQPYGDVLNVVLDDNQTRLDRLLPRTSPPAVLFNGRPPGSALGSLTGEPAKLKTEYERAYNASLEQLDRGSDPHQLAQVFDRTALAIAAAIPPGNIQPGPPDEGSEEVPTDHPLAAPSLEVRGLPTYGSAKAPYAITVLCIPTSQNCKTPMSAAKNTQRLFPRQVRIVLASFFDVSRDDAAALGQLGDAALCAEQIGTVGGDGFATGWDDESPGWRWADAVLRATARGGGRKVDPDQLIDRVVASLKLDSHKMSACRAKIAGATFERITAARHAGIKTTPSVVIGGRIYAGGITDQAHWQNLVEAELAPGALGGGLCGVIKAKDKDKEFDPDDYDCSLFRVLMLLGTPGKHSSTE
jgi:protein-disulfide isomerase